MWNRELLDKISMWESGFKLLVVLNPKLWIGDVCCARKLWRWIWMFFVYSKETFLWCCFMFGIRGRRWIKSRCIDDKLKHCVFRFIHSVSLLSKKVYIYCCWRKMVDFEFFSSLWVSNIPQMSEIGTFFLD